MIRRVLRTASLSRCSLAFLVLAVGALGAGCGGQESPAESDAETKATERARRTEARGRVAERKLLASLGYVDGVQDPNADQRGVIDHDPARSEPGLNLYCDRKLKSAFLFDMDGKIVHRWTVARGVDHCEVESSGDLVALIQDRRLMKVDRDSRVLWQIEAEFHHEFHRNADGSLAALARRPVDRPDLHPSRRVYEDLVLEISPDGEIVGEISLLDAFLDSPYRYLLPAVAHLEVEAQESGEEPVLDLLHSNTVQVLDGALADRSPLFAAGNQVVCLRNVNAILIVEAGSGRILWLWGPSNLVYPHHPTLLPNGNLLIFNNGLGASEILEVDPETFAVVWRYEDGEEFYSASRGSVQRLAGGNTLVTESNPGYAFEVTPTGETVWEWANPHILDGGKRAFVWRVERYATEELSFLGE